MSARLITLRLLYQLDIFFPILLAALFLLMLIAFKIYCSIIFNPKYRKWDNSRKCRYLVNELDYVLAQIGNKVYLVPPGISDDDINQESTRVWKLNTLTNYTWKEIRQGYREPVRTPKFLQLISKLVGGSE